MPKIKTLFLAILFIFPLHFSIAENPNWDEIRNLLQGDGLVGRVHGVVSDRNQAVLNYHIPGRTDPFGFPLQVQLPLTSSNPEILTQLRSLTRNSQIRIKGRLIENRAPIRHVEVTQITVIDAYHNPIEATRQPYSPQVIQRLRESNSIIGIVHATTEERKFFVLDYQDAVLPVFIPNHNNERLTEILRTLNRHDKVSIRYQVLTSNNPNQPLHLRLDTSVDKPLQVLESNRDLHEKQVTLEGHLLVFPANRTLGLSRNTYGVEVNYNDGTRRDFFIYSEDEKVYEPTFERLEKFWESTKEAIIQTGRPRLLGRLFGCRRQCAVESNPIVYYRNRYMNQRAIVQVSGKINLFSPNQANPQILFDREEALRLWRVVR